MGVFYPFIVENGGAIFIPRSYFPFPFDYHRKVDNLLAIELGSPYKEIRRLLDEVRAKGGFHFRGFGDMSVEEVAQVTGLGIELARLAKQREYSETLVIASEAKQSHVTCREIDKALGKIKGVGLNWTHGGRFYDIMGANDKGKAVNILVDLYRQMWGEVETIGLGDSLNDLPMLSVVGLPILVQKKDGNWEEMNLPRLRRVQGIGPEGWSRAIRELIEGCLIQQQSLSSGGKHGA
jgi:mannosyl-3-phosphoglycerate phosphatase